MEYATSIFVFRFPTTLNDRFQIFNSFFWSFVSEFELRFRFSCLFFCHFRILPEPEECWDFLSLTIDQLETTSLMKSLSTIFLLRKDLFGGNQESFPESKEFHGSLLSVKRFFSCHGIKKRRSVADAK